MPEKDDILLGALRDLGVKEEELKLDDEDEIIEDEVDEDEVIESDDEDYIEDEEELEEDEEETSGLKKDLENKEFKPEKTKYTKEDKQQYAFEQLRKKAKESEETQKQLDELALAYGFQSHKEMIEKLQKDANAKKAKEQGVDPKFYEDLQQTKRELESLKQERQQEVTRNKVNTFINRVDEFAKENNLDTTEREELITSLDEDGLTLETLVSIKNYKKLFAGYIGDKIIAKEKQKQLEKEEKRKNLRESTFEDTGNPDSKFDLMSSIDALLKKQNSRY